MNKGPVRVYTIRKVDRISLDIYQISKIILPFDRYFKGAMEAGSSYDVLEAGK